MKIRLGFVTNSSSSSFVLAGRHLDASELVQAARPIALYEEGCDGLIIFDVTPEMIPILIENKGTFTFIDATHFATDTVAINLPQGLPEGSVIMGGEFSINSPENVAEIKYLLGDDEA